MADPTRLLAHEMAALLRDGEVSSRELTEAHLAAAERDNRGLNAWLTIDRERAVAEADAADARLAAARTDPGHALDTLRPLLGIPVALKDLVSVAGGQCTAGSRILEGWKPPYDATVTARLKAQSRRAEGGWPHGLATLSMPRNAGVSSAGNLESSSTRFRRSPTILSTCSMVTGQASTHAPQVTQSHTAS